MQKTRIELSDNDLEKVTGGDIVRIEKDGEMYRIFGITTGEPVLDVQFKDYDEAVNWATNNLYIVT